MRRSETHIESIALVSYQLSKLRHAFVFTGGAVVGLLLTDPAAADVRPTDDVDVIVATTKYSEFALLQDDLRKLGFKHDMNGPNCRFILEGLPVDIMPTSGAILGFTNRWYDFAMASHSNYVLPDATTIRLISAVAFIATKLEAFHDRGKEDFISSHDLEDIVAVIDGRSELIGEMKAANPAVREYISKAFTELLKNPDFLDSIPVHLLPDVSSQARKGIIVDRIRTLSNL